MMSALPVFCFAWTVVLYILSKSIYRRIGKIWLSPAIVVPALTVILMIIARIPYSAYIADTRWIVWLLGPATVAFAVPIYEYRDTVRRHWLALFMGVCVGMTVALVSSLLLARAFRF